LTAVALPTRWAGILEVTEKPRPFMKRMFHLTTCIVSVGRGVDSDCQCVGLRGLPATQSCFWEMCVLAGYGWEGPPSRGGGPPGLFGRRRPLRSAPPRHCRSAASLGDTGIPGTTLGPRRRHAQYAETLLGLRYRGRGDAHRSWMNPPALKLMCVSTRLAGCLCRFASVLATGPVYSGVRSRQLRSPQLLPQLHDLRLRRTQGSLRLMQGLPCRFQLRASAGRLWEDKAARH
jgi:hypothetical protein